MSFQYTVKHALVQSQQILNVVFAVVTSSSCRNHHILPPSCCTQSHHWLCSSCQNYPICMEKLLIPFRTHRGTLTWPPVSAQCAEQTHRAVRKFSCLEMKTCSLLQLWSLPLLAREEWKVDRMLPFSIVNLNYCLFHLLFHVTCPLLPIY